MAVQEICGSGNNFTFTHFVDIFKGKKTQKVVLHGKIDCYLTIWLIIKFLELFKNRRKQLSPYRS